MKSPDFILSTDCDSTGDLALLRLCWVKCRMRDGTRDDHMLVEVEPPLIGQDHGLGALNITRLILSSRYQGETLYPIGQWPCHVYISRILDERISETLYVTNEQVEIIAWGMIFRTVEDAKSCNKNLKRNGT